MGCRSINVLRLGLRMFSMNLSLSFSCNTGARKAKQSRDGIVAGVCQYLCWCCFIFLACSYQTTSSIYQIKQLNTTEYEGLLTAH